MGRYIDAEKIKITADTMIADGECYVPLSAVKQAIARTPTEDVVKVVRCKDCKYFSELQHCGVLGFCEPNEYCSRGEMRKEDEGKLK